MPGNSQRRGATRKGASRKGSSVGSGGQRRAGLEGRGPTPKATERTKHPAAKQARAAEKRAERPDGAAPARSGFSGGAPGGQSGRSGPSGGSGPRGGSGSGGFGSGGSGPRRASGTPKRARASSEIVAGRNSVVEALRADVPATTMYVAGKVDSDDRVREAIKTATARSIPILETPRGELDRLTEGAVHQGLALQVPPYSYLEPRDLFNPEAPGIPLVVALDGITDPRNLGAIIRSVGAFGGHGVIVPERRSAGMTASAWKTSAGAAARVPVALASNLTRALEDFHKAGFFIIGLDMDGDVELPAMELAGEPLVIVVGSEGKGLSRLVRETCDQIVSIPMSSTAESLNAGIATGVALYEVARRRAEL